MRRMPELEFSVMRDTLGANDANLSKNPTVLGDAGLVTARMESFAARPDAL